MTATRAEDEVANRRLDAFVDAAFAFSVTLLLISGGAATSLDDLVAALGRLPAFLASFALIAMFWLSHRDYGRMARLRGPAATLLSLAIVFVVLVYVFPLRLLTETAFHFLSGGRLPGQGLLGSFSDLRTLYVVYGAGFVVLAALYALLFATVRGERAASPAHEVDAREWTGIYLVLMACGVLSILAALVGPLRHAPWLPGVVYGLIPLGQRLVARYVRPRPTLAETPAE